MNPAARWNPATKIAFRFVFSYFALLGFQYLIELLPWGDFLSRKYDAFWHVIVVGWDRQFLRTGYSFAPLDAVESVSNTAYGWLLFLCWVMLAAAVTVVWSILDRRRPNYGWLHQWLRLLLRYMLALSMIHYGIIKLIPTQMTAPPPPFMLLNRLGELPPMRLLWLFIGSSPAYETFTGCAELLGGVLLLVPRTTLLGALVCVADMVNVVMLNFCYDVHVKLISIQFLAMAVILVAPDLRRLAGLLLFNRGVGPAESPPLFSHRWLDRAPQILFFLFGLYTIGTTFVTTYKWYQTFHPSRPPLYGAWSVREFVVDDQEVPLFTDPQRWRWVVFTKLGSVTVETMIGSRKSYSLHLDMKTRTMLLGSTPPKEPERAELSFAKPATDVLTLDGKLNGHRMHARLHKMTLISTGFHWIFVPPKEE
ncbi:MAG TPA: hypothetical protein VLX28_17725 [Thermoanaerobaculia bacterium]|nr:hypothetical protein [Thermoanaerobaculia bacterium]